MTLRKNKLIPVFIAILYFYLPATAIAAITNETTSVKIFKPTLPAGKPKLGYCWTESIAAQRKGAWRCMLGNSIYDPCFSTTDLNKVVCDADPITHTAGFVLQLTKPLPKTTVDSIPANSVWMLQLADGSVCKPYTGTLPAVNNTPVRFYCSDSGKCKRNGSCEHMTGILDFPTPEKVWVAQKVIYSVSPKSIVNVIAITPVTITTVWQ
jgi:hypothetical protein